MKPWGRRHPVSIWILFAMSVLLLFSGNTGAVITGLIGVAIAYQLFGHPGIRRGTKPPVQTQSVLPAAPRVGANRVTAPDALGRLNALPTRSRIAIVNHLEPGEEPQFVVPGVNQDALIGTDRRLFLIPEGRHGHEKLWALPYQLITGAGIEQERGGARLLISTQKTPHDMLPKVRLSGDVQVESGITAIQEIRRRIATAQRTGEEAMSPATQSAFAETTYRAIPSGRSQSSLSLGNMLEMTPTEFEVFVGKALGAMGYTNVNRVGGSGDLGADLTVTDPQGRSAVVQCKRYTPGSKVGSPTLQSFIGMTSVHHKVDRGIFVTTADYSQQAIDLAKEHDIVLIDGDDLVKIAALVLTPPFLQGALSESAPVRYCPNCGSGVQGGMKYCANCGTSLGVSPS